MKSNLANQQVLPTRVVQLGPSLSQQGGMATVQNILLSMHLEGFEAFHISTHDEGSLVHRLGTFATALLRCVVILISHKDVSIVHIHMSERGSVFRVLILVILFSIGRRKTVVHTHGAEFEEFYQQQAPATRWIISKILRKCDRFIVLSKSWQEYYAKALQIPIEHISILQNPVNMPDCLPHDVQELATDGKFEFLFAGRIGERKGTYKLLGAFAKLISTCPNVHLTLAGDGELKKAADLAKRLDISEKITLMGWVDAHGLKNLLSSADAFILPSLNEGLPMAILEAMSWQLPIIASPVGGIPEVVIPGKTGLLINPESSESIYQAMQSLVKNPDYAKQLGQNARTQVEAFSSAHYQDRLSELYQKVMSGQKG